MTGVLRVVWVAGDVRWKGGRRTTETRGEVGSQRGVEKKRERENESYDRKVARRDREGERENERSAA